jgi:hypothetical protein
LKGGDESTGQRGGVVPEEYSSNTNEWIRLQSVQGAHERPLSSGASAFVRGFEARVCTWGSYLLLSLLSTSRPPETREVSLEEHSGGLAVEAVSMRNEQVLEWDELTSCIRGSETGNAIELCLDCLESLEECGR